MKALVISDTHGNTRRAFIAHTQAEPVDVIIHLGDGCADAELLRVALDVPVISVAGNCDPVSNVPRECLWECEGKRILLTHGDAYQVKSGLSKLQRRADEIGADAVLYGHTHVGRADSCAGLQLINPGTLANHGSHHSYAVLTITPEGISSQHFTVE